MQRGSYFTVVNRMAQNHDFFERVWRLQPKYMAAMGEHTKITFDLFHESRALIRSAAIALTYQLPIPPKVRSEEDYQLRVQYRKDIWGDKEGDRVAERLDQFRERIERECRAVIRRNLSEKR